jgi:hypothetical protein
MDKNSLDILGIKPIGDAINTTVTKSFDGVEGFLKIVCIPALEEVGLMMKDQVRSWRLSNILRILNKAQGKLDLVDGKLEIKAHPRVALAIIEHGSVNDDDEIQELWAGLFASSCTAEGRDDENLIFVNLLKQLTKAEARILKYTVESTHKVMHPNRLVTAMGVMILTGDDLTKITGLNDMHRLDRELDHLQSMDLIQGGFSTSGKELCANIIPTALALNLYAKTQGSNKTMDMFWEKDIVNTQEKLNAEHEQRLKEIKAQADLTEEEFTKETAKKGQ